MEMSKKTQPRPKPAPPRTPRPEADGDRGQDSRHDPVLRFSPHAWAKLLFFRDRGQTEIGGFGITPADDLLYVEDFITVQQSATVAGVTFEDEAVNEFLDNQVDAGCQPVQVLRVWCHTHPGSSPEPSCVDEETFSRVFGRCDHAVMFVLATGGKSYARLRFNVGPGGDVRIPVEVDYSQPFASSDFDAWQAEYKANVKARRERLWPGMELGWDDQYGIHADDGSEAGQTLGADLCVDDYLLAELAGMDPDEREYVLAEFGLSADDLPRELEAYS